MGIKELELFTIKIGYSLLVISSNCFLGLGPLRWRAGMQLRVAAAENLLCRSLAVPPCYRWRAAAEPAAEDLAPSLPPFASRAVSLPPRTCCAASLLCCSPEKPPCYRWEPVAENLPCR